MNKSKADQAAACFSEGFNCAQAVFTAYSEELGLDEQTALRLACGFGAGMGRLGNTCGAVSGAILLLGLKYGKSKKEDNPARERTYELVREFTKRFEERNGTTICRELLGDEPAKIKDPEPFRTICPKMIRDAVEIVEELLFSGADASGS